jgi:Glycosyl transferase family 2/N-terminal domain of galactosyltransferase
MTRADSAQYLNSRLLALYLRLSSGGAVDEEQVIAEMTALRSSTPPALAAIFDRYARLIQLHLAPDGAQRLSAALATQGGLPDQTPRLPPAFAHIGHDLPPLSPDGLPGISLVTCSMNRTHNLLRALPSWLAAPEITEIVIVDWSSTRPVAQDLAEAGVTDPRIRILRIEDEPRWVLTYAFNAGFRAAACRTILKADADIVLSPDFFRRNALMPGSFLAGNWRQAAEDQAHVNGFFLIQREGLHQVGGFNEHITSYGWDDDDLYDRLILSGLRRQDVVPGTILHLPHDDAERLADGAGAAQGPPSLGQDLASGTQALIRSNRYIASVMPPWDAAAILLPFRLVAHEGPLVRLRRDGWVPSLVPDHVALAARDHALRELASWRLSRRVLELGPDRIVPLLNRPASDVSRIDVEIALAQPEFLPEGPGKYRALELPEGVLDAPDPDPALGPALVRLIDQARARGVHPVLRAPHLHLPLGAPGCLRLIPLIPSWEPVGDVPDLTLDVFLADTAALWGHHRLVLQDPADFAPPCLAAPALTPHRPRLFIDVQHGLGNRLRALGSAAAIAEATGRELVVVWQPDDHCSGHLSDLYDYPGAVETTRFLDDAAQSGAAVYNYMPAEPGAAKDAPIRLDTSADIYARAASVLNSPASYWEGENRFLQSLSPIAQVRDLVASVRHPNDLSAHVRMEGGRQHEHLTYEKADNWTAQDHALIDEWRQKSHFSHFLRRIDALIAEGRAQRIFLAADMPDTYAEFRQRYGDRLAFLPRSLFDRSASQLHYALADAILLSRAPRLLGSTWSSFSELAMRLAPVPMAIEMSGKDF